MYKTLDEILRDMLDNISDDHDKREGSLIYDAIKPAAIEMALAYKDLEQINKNIAIDTATGDALTELCYQNGTFRKENESDEQLRIRHRNKIIMPAQDGNAAQYRDWADNYDGVGAAKVFPLWQGGNTVKVAITNAVYQVAEPELVSAFQTFLDPGSQGLGNGVAPIGIKVTVTGGIQKDINITGNIVLADGYDLPEGVADAVSSYLASLTYVKNNVSYMRVAVAILDCPSIADLSNLTINGSNVDIALIGDEIPLLNSINLAVVSP